MLNALPLLWLAGIFVAFECVQDCHGARFAGQAWLDRHHPHRRLKGNVTATGRVDVHPPFRLFQVLSKKYEVGKPHAEVGANAAIVITAFSTADISDEESNNDGNDGSNANEDGGGDDDDPSGENVVAVRTRKPVPQCTPRPTRASRTPAAAAGDGNEKLDEQISAESPSAAAAALLDTQVSSDSGSDASAPLSSGATAVAAGNVPSSGSGTSNTATAGEVTPSPDTTMKPDSQAPGASSSAPQPLSTSPPTTASNTSSSPSASSGTSISLGNLNSGSDAAAGFVDHQSGSNSNPVNPSSPNVSSKPQVAGETPSSSSQSTSGPLSSKPGTSSNNAPCTPMSVEGDATFCIPPNDEPKLSCSGPVSTQVSSSSLSSFDPNRICPRKGDTAIGACHPGLRSFNLTSNSCIALEDSRCIVIHTGVWGCAFSFSPSSKTGSTVPTNSTRASNTNLHDSTTLQTSGASSKVTTTSFQTPGSGGGDHPNGPIVLVVAAVAACVLAVLGIVKRTKQRAELNVSEEGAAAQRQETTDFSYYPKTPDISKATEAFTLSLETLHAHM